MKRLAAGIALLTLILALPASPGVTAVPVTQTAVLAQHWVQSWGYRDELTPTNIDYQHFWSDNAGKILTMAEITHDPAAASNATQFISKNIADGYYLPEVVINSTSPSWIKDAGGRYLTNGIVELHGDNSSDALEQLEIGNNYTGYLPLAYVGGDRLWLNVSLTCCAIKSQSSTVFVIHDGFSKRSMYEVNGSEFDTFVNATLSLGAPYASVSLQVEPLSSTGPPVSYAFLQLFNTTTTYPFETASYYAANGAFVKSLGARNATSVSGTGLAMTYSNHASVFTNYQSSTVSGQDAVAVAFGNKSIYDIEHWANDPPFSHSWLGVGYNVPSLSPGTKGPAVDSEVFPLEHFDFRMANETSRYISSPRANVSVVPPVSFGFDALGLSLLAHNDPAYLSIAKVFWNSYFDRYIGTSPFTAYARSINTFALAGFELYGCNNQTVESFTRDYVGVSPGSSIEEYGWAAAALQQLSQCTKSQSDAALYHGVLSRFSPSSTSFIELNVTGATPPE